MVQRVDVYVESLSFQLYKRLCFFFVSFFSIRTKGWLLHGLELFHLFKATEKLGKQKELRKNIAQRDDVTCATIHPDFSRTINKLSQVPPFKRAINKLSQIRHF